MKIEESNKLIAEFMGLDVSVNIATRAVTYNTMPNSDYPLYAPVEYSTSWDWLMPVVEKLENDFLLSVNISRIECDIYWMGAEPEDAKLLKILEKIPSMGTIGNTKLQAVYSAVLQFIHFYNKTK